MLLADDMAVGGKPRGLWAEVRLEEVSCGLPAYLASRSLTFTDDVAGDSCRKGLWMDAGGGVADFQKSSEDREVQISTPRTAYSNVKLTHMCQRSHVSV